MPRDHRDDVGREAESRQPLPVAPASETTQSQTEVVRLEDARRERRQRDLASLASHPEHMPANPRQNWVAVGFLVILCLLGYWLYRELNSSLHVEQCVEAGFRDCASRAGSR